MLYAFILGIGLMVGLALIIPWLTQVEPAKLLRGLTWVFFGLLALIGLGLLLTGRLGWAIAALGAVMPWLLGVVRRFVQGRLLGALFGGLGEDRTTGQGAGGGTSDVSSRFLSMSLDLDSGVMSGTVQEGRYAGRTLDSLTLAEALDLRAEVAAEADSLRLLDTWLDRAHPGWGDDGSARRGGAGATERPPGAPMDRTEALRVLGLDEGADDEAIKEAYRRLMAQAHPDHGGSAWMAAKLNEAREALLGGSASR